MTRKHSHATDVINKMFLFSQHPQDYGIRAGLDRTSLKGRDVSTPHLFLDTHLCSWAARSDSFIRITAGSQLKQNLSFSFSRHAAPQALEECRRTGGVWE